jgi:hypothetical protein
VFVGRWEYKGGPAVDVDEFLSNLNVRQLFRLWRLVEEVFDTIRSLRNGQQVEANESLYRAVQDTVHQMVNQFQGLEALIDAGRTANEVCGEFEVVSGENAPLVQNRWKRCLDQFLSRGPIHPLNTLRTKTRECVRKIPEGKEKAEAYLTDGVTQTQGYDAPEALTYQISRGIDCTGECTALVHRWAESIPRYRPRGERLLGYARCPSYDQQRLTDLMLEITVLRTVEWLEKAHVDGVEHLVTWCEEWIGRLKSEEGSLPTGPLARALLLFSLCRTSRGLDFLEQSDFGPGIDPFNELFEIRDDQQDDNNPILRAAAVFAAQSARAQFSNDILPSMLRVLLTSRNAREGTWSAGAGGKFSPLAAAMVVHALAVVRPLGWQEPARMACQRLRRAQKPEGYWIDRYCDKATMTVLALDAIQLVENPGQPKTTLPEGVFEVGNPHIGDVIEQPEAAEAQLLQEPPTRGITQREVGPRTGRKSKFTKIALIAEYLRLHPAALSREISAATGIHEADVRRLWGPIKKAQREGRYFRPRGPRDAHGQVRPTGKTASCHICGDPIREPFQCTECEGQPLILDECKTCHYTNTHPDKATP